ncbi:MAG: alpha/beta fold hydrolase [Bacteroidota bacterium]
MTDVSVSEKQRSTTFRNTLFGAGVLLVALIFAGRQKPVDTTIKAKSFGAELDESLRASESQYDDIIAGTEKKIVWASEAQEKTPISIVYIHGFSATRQETAPLSDTLAERFGANLFYTRLTGHGRPGEAMGEATVNDWLNDAHEALEIGRQIGEKVIVIGTSTGGTLATWLAAQEDTDGLAGVVLISPNYWLRAPGAGLMLMPWGKQILHAIQGTTYEWEPQNTDHGKYWTNSYPSSSLHEMMRLLDYVNNMELEQISVPALFVYSPNDQVVNPIEIEATFARFGSENKKLEAIEEVEDRSNHVLAGRILSPASTLPIASTISAFVAEL